VKPQSNNPEACECGGVVISKILGFSYLEETFIETLKNWQDEWFYISDVPLDNPPRAGIVTPFTRPLQPSLTHGS
jgi:hypothetical protein